VNLQHKIVEQWHIEAGQAYVLLSNMASRLAHSGLTFPDK